MASLGSAGFGLALSVLASSAAAQLPFTEEAAARGISGPMISSSEGESFGYGLAFADLDLDGDADLVQIGRVGGAVGLFQNDGQGVFTNLYALSGMSSTPKASGVTCADYDGDRDLDVYISCSVASNRLYRNEGNFQFTEVAVAAGVADPGPGMGTAWGDFDGDGWLDFFLANRTGELHPGENKLYRNQGDGTFVDVMKAVGIGHGDAPTFQPLFLDYDQDGDQDLYVSNDKGYTPEISNHLYENQDGTFVEVTAASGTAAEFDSMGVAAADFDGDRTLDIYATNTPEGNALFLQLQPGVFFDLAAEVGVESFRLGWGVSFLDCDNDGLRDIYVCNAPLGNRLYVQGPGLACVDLAPALGVDDAGRAYGSATADIDGDGDVDLAVANFFDPLLLYVNHNADTPGPQNRWVRLRVHGRGANRHAIGALLDVEAAGVRQIAQVAAGSSFKSQDDLVQSFGLAGATLVGAIDVRWPDGGQRLLRNYAVNRTYDVYMHDRLGDHDGDGRVSQSDVAPFLDCWTGSGPGRVEPGCEMMDFDGDGDVDPTDTLRFVQRLERHAVAPVIDD